MLKDVADPVTERMRSETGHDCVACPTRARNLAATAHNAAGAARYALESGGDVGRALRKLGELERELAQWEAISDQHFAALNEWERP